MRKIIYSMTALAALGGTSAAMADDHAATAETEMTAEAPATETPATETAVAAEARTFTDAEITSFAKATIAASEVDADTTLTPDEKAMALVSAVEANGIDPATYNDIVQAMRTDAELEQKISAALTAQSSTAEADG